MAFSFSTYFPPALTSRSDARASFRATVAPALRRALEPIAAAAAATSPGSIATGYQVAQVSGTDLGFAVRNASPSWPFVEYDTKPHWPPYGPGSALAQWAQGKGLPPFLVARKISRHGTVGRLMLTTAWAQGIDAVREELYRAIGRWWSQGGLV